MIGGTVLLAVPSQAAVAPTLLAQGATADLSTDPADVGGVDGVADIEAFTCNCPAATGLRPINGAGWTAAGETWASATLAAAQADTYNTGVGGFVPDPDGVYYVRTANDRYYKLRHPTGGTNDASGITIEWEYLGTGAVPPPTASFTFTSYDVYTEFTDTSTGTVSSWSWTFGDGGVASNQHPTHAYAGAGTYNACLTASNVDGSDGPVCQNVEIIEETSTSVASAGAIDFDTDGTDDLMLFTPSGCSETNAFDVINAAQWASFSADYRTRMLSDAQSASLGTSNFCVESGTPFEGFFILTSGGTYVKVWVPTNDGSGARFVYEILGSTLPAPTASFTFTSYDVYTEFTDTSTGTVTTWAWTFGDGEVSSAANPVHSYASASTYNACLTATNGGGSDGPVCQDVTITEEPSTLVAADATIDLDGDGTDDLALFDPSGCSNPNGFRMLNGATWDALGGDYRTQTLADAQAAVVDGTSDFCNTTGDPFDGFFVLTSGGTYFKVWVPENAASGARFILAELGSVLAADVSCTVGGSATVQITSGDGPFDIAWTLDGVPQTDLTGLGAGAHVLTGDALGPNQFTGVVVTETSGDAEVLDLGGLDCEVPLDANAECAGADLVVTVLGGDGDFELTASGAFTATITELGSSTFAGPDTWDGLQIDELGGDEVAALGDFVCSLPPTTSTTTNPTTTTTTSTTTTTTVVSDTTTTVVSDTTTSTTVAGATTTTLATGVPGGGLPETGAPTLRLLVVALGLLAAGAMILLVRRVPTVRR